MEVREEDIRRIIRLVRLDFLSFSSDTEEDELAVGGGDTTSLLETDRLRVERVFGKPGLPLVWVEGGRDGDNIDGVEDDGSRLIERRRSEREARPWLIISLTTVIDERLSTIVVTVVFEVLDVLDEVDNLLSWMVSFGGVSTAL